jgi:hypothetical protein
MDTVLWQFRFLQRSARSCDVQSFPKLRPLTRCFLSDIMQATLGATRGTGRRAHVYGAV